MATQVFPNRFAAPSAAAAQKSAKKPLLQRVFDFIVEAQTRRAEQEIARYLGARGFKFTDGAEREVERRFINTHSKL